MNQNKLQQFHQRYLDQEITYLKKVSNHHKNLLLVERKILPSVYSVECIHILNCVHSLLKLELDCMIRRWRSYATLLIESTLLCKDWFEDWEDNESVLTYTITKKARHAVLHRFYRYQNSGHTPIVVVGVKFLSDGGIPLLELTWYPSNMATQID